MDLLNSIPENPLLLIAITDSKCLQLKWNSSVLLDYQLNYKVFRSKIIISMKFKFGKNCTRAKLHLKIGLTFIFETKLNLMG